MERKIKDGLISLAPILINAGGTAFAISKKSVEGAYISNFFTQVLQFFVLKYNYEYEYKRPSFCPSPGEEARMLVNRSSSPNVQDGDSADKPVIPFIVLQHVMGDFGAPIITTVLKVHQTPGHTFDDTNNFSIFALSVFVAGFGCLELCRQCGTGDAKEKQSIHLEQTAFNATASLIGVIAYFMLKPTPDQIQLDVLGSDVVNDMITWNFQALLISTAHESGLLNIDGVDVNLTVGVSTNFYVPCQNDDPLPINAYWVVNDENVTDFSLYKSWSDPLYCNLTPTTTTTTPTTTTEPTTTTSTTTEPTTTTPTPEPHLSVNLGGMVFTGNGDFDMPISAWTSSRNPPLDEMVHFIGTSNNGLVTGVDQFLSWEQILRNQSHLSSRCYGPGDSQIVFNLIDGVSISPDTYLVRCANNDFKAHDVVGEVDHLSNDSSTGVATPIAVAGIAGGVFVVAMALKRLASWFRAPAHQEIEEKGEDTHSLGGSSRV